MSNLTIKSIAEAERPYEKCMRQGASVLSDAELLAVLLRTGSRNKNSIDLSMEILSSENPQDNLSVLHRLTYPKLRKIKGVGKVKAIQILCICELSKRLAQAEVAPALTFSEPKSIADYYMESLRHLSREEIHVMYFDSRRRLLKEMKLAIGTVQWASTTPREILVEALKYEAVFMILVHNHPSGNPAPSEADMHFTKRVQQAGDIIGVALSDHIIIGNHNYLSFRERGMLL